MKKTVLILILILGTLNSYNQEINVIKLENEFQLLEKSNTGDKIVLQKTSIQDTSLIEYNTLINSLIGEINGPFKSGSITFYTKTIKIDTAYLCHVGNIWISSSNGWDFSENLANEILDKVNKGGDYNKFCNEYSDDKNQKIDCDLGWTFSSNFVESFANGIETHDEGQVFVVKTKFGFHVVKIIEQGKWEQKSLTYSKLKI